MALTADANSEYLQRNSGTFFSTASMSVLFWVKLITDRNANFVPWIIVDGASSYIGWDSPSGDGVTIRWEQSGAGEPNIDSFTYSLNTWYCVGLTRAGNGANQTIAYRRTLTDTSWTTASGTFGNGDITPTSETVLTNFFNTTTGWLAGPMANLKEWNAVLTGSQLWIESEQYAPVRTANLQAWYPMDDDTVAGAALDRSGNGRDFTVTGALTLEAGPPIRSWRNLLHPNNLRPAIFKPGLAR